MILGLQIWISRTVERIPRIFQLVRVSCLGWVFGAARTRRMWAHTSRCGWGLFIMPVPPSPLPFHIIHPYLSLRRSELQLHLRLWAGQRTWANHQSYDSWICACYGGILLCSQKAERIHGTNLILSLIFLIFLGHITLAKNIQGHEESQEFLVLSITMHTPMISLKLQPRGLHVLSDSSP